MRQCRIDPSRSAWKLLDGLDDLLLGIHEEGAVGGDRFVQGSPIIRMKREGAVRSGW